MTHAASAAAAAFPPPTPPTLASVSGQIRGIPFGKDAVEVARLANEAHDAFLTLFEQVKPLSPAVLSPALSESASSSPCASGAYGRVVVVSSGGIGKPIFSAAALAAFLRLAIP